MLKNIKIMIILSGLAILLLAPGGAAADYTTSIMDNTWMQPRQYGAVSTYSGWSNWRSSPIASDPTAWEVSRVDVTWSGSNLEMKIFTNYPQAGLECAGLTDISLSPGASGNGSFSYGIDMRNWDSEHHLANIYSGVSWNNPNTYWASTGYIYTGGYNPKSIMDNPQVPNTVINSHSGEMGQAKVTFSNAPAGSGSTYMWEILFPTNFNADGSWDSFDFTLGSGSCANDFFAGTATSGNPAPIPASFLLLATGLMAMGLLRYRKKAVLVPGDKK